MLQEYPIFNICFDSAGIGTQRTILMFDFFREWENKFEIY